VTEHEERALREELDSWYFAGYDLLQDIQQQHDAIPQSDKANVQHEVVERVGMGWVRDYAGYQTPSRAGGGPHAFAVEGQQGITQEKEIVPLWRPSVDDMQTAACLASSTSGDRCHDPEERAGAGAARVRPPSASRAVTAARLANAR